MLKYSDGLEKKEGDGGESQSRYPSLCRNLQILDPKKEGQRCARVVFAVSREDSMEETMEPSTILFRRCQIMKDIRDPSEAVYCAGAL